MRHKRTTAATQSYAKQPNQAAIFIRREIDFTPRRVEANVGAVGDPARVGGSSVQGVAQVTSLQKGNLLKRKRKWMSL